jgi:hypothetical protein
MQCPRILPSIAILLAGACSVAWGAQEQGPLARIELRYRIVAPTLQRVARFDRLVHYLESIGFHKDPGAPTEAEDIAEARMRGQIPVERARQVLEEPAVRSVLIMPLAWRPPEDLKQPVKVRLELAGGLPPDRQRLLEEQARDRLVLLGFREAIGYDHRGHSRLVGTVPAGEVETLLGDLREVPLGWFTPVVPLADLPLPIKDIDPIRVIEVTPEPAGIPPAAVPPALPGSEIDPSGLWKIDPELRTGERLEPVRLEVILRNVPAPTDENWRRAIGRAGPGIDIEGRFGQFVSVRAPSVKAAQTLALLPFVSGVRLPPPASTGPTGLPGNPIEPAKALEETGIAAWHAKGATGAGVRIAVIDDDFRGHEKLTGKRGKARYVDLTSMLNPAMQPEPFVGKAGEVGHGTHAAMIARLAAPDADLLLVRIDAASPYQLQEAAQRIGGEVFRSGALDQRRAEIEAEAETLQLRRGELNQRRQAFLEKYGAEPDPAKEREWRLKEPPEQEREMRERWQAIERDEADLAQRRREYHRREDQLAKLQDDLQSLKGTPVVINSLVWNRGYGVSGESGLTRFFNNWSGPRPLWFQAGGDDRGQTWAGLFRDVDSNGIMEFAPPEAPLTKGRWTAELNFLGWQPHAGEKSPEMPAPATVRISMQWREPHDPEFFADANDPYRVPLAKLGMMVLRQRDPSGKSLAADDMEVIVQAAGVPQRLENEPMAATYEQSIIVRLPSAGRYALRVDGRVPPGIRPPGVASLPIIERSWELWPRIHVDVLDEASRRQGRPVFLDYATDYGGPGTPADASSLLAVGAADASGQPESTSTLGPALARALVRKPDVFSFGEIQLPGGGPTIEGTSAAAAFTGGVTAALLSGGVPARDVEAILRGQAEGVIKVPEVLPAGKSRRR